jgi:predicted nuclease of restriction endonuclease-like (RecB) superfamily
MAKGKSPAPKTATGKTKATPRPAANTLPPGYAKALKDIKARIRAAQVKAALSINRELVILYWQIGKTILDQQETQGWGAKVIDRLSSDLRREFPGQKGFSARNLRYMRALAEAYPDAQFVQQAVAQIPWGHNVRILDHVNDPIERQWYIGATVQNGWSRAVLVHQIESDLYGRQGKALTNFEATLPAPESDLVQQLVKDPYHLDFLGLGADLSERQLEQALVDRLKDFLVELCKGFAFVGQQVHMEVAGNDYYVDLLFYHLHLRCYMVIELKVEPFKPEFAGKMNFYLSAVDDLLRHPDDQPSIGLILCKERNRLVVEYALRDTSKPMGVATYRVLPRRLKGELPTAREIASGIQSRGEDKAS